MNIKQSLAGIILALTLSTSNATETTMTALINTLKVQPTIGKAYVLGVLEAGNDAFFCAPQWDIPILVDEMIKLITKPSHKPSEIFPANVYLTMLAREVYPCSGKEKTL